MKKRILISISLIMALSMSTQAQKLRTGIKVGANLSQLASIEGAVSKPGLNAGIFLNSKLGPVGIQADFLYKRMGSKYETPVLLNDYEERTLNLDYIQIPVVAKFHPVPMLNAHAGPYFGYLINVDDESDLLGKDDFVKTDFGLTFGLGFKISRLMLEARYGVGLVDVFEKDGTEYNNSSLSFNVGFEL
ncbi:MAG: porin family protein [Bacteroidota bacterium]|nr:porin family protein [Bacteroidota bacterium]